ncbi:ABC transporter family substrate-binding protein [Smaragdicoccus niigatensis]|uniref:ABC transporter family substrate-binding protein n=1 Tax=Smaragdicoccus niigatensis TaxID=359359 RepID=UPI0003A29671|nr:ABC transporter family substrate-binding protein [Smaragdicoccus niigatensis]
MRGRFVVILCLILAISACSISNPDDDARGSGKSSLATAWEEAFYAYNANTTNGNNVVNANIQYLMNGSFNYYTADSKLAKDETFGTYRKVSDNPLVVKYTVNDATKWSDGTPVDAADLLLEWGAISGRLNTVAADQVHRDKATGQPDNTASEVFFDAAAYVPGQGLSLVTATPEISDNDKSLTLSYDQPWADWELDMSTIGEIIPAHVTAMHALGLTDARQAKSALIMAIQDRDKTALQKIANFWNSGFNFTSLPKDSSLYLSNGAYLLTNLVENQYATLTKNPNYHGMREPKVDTLTVRFNPDPMAQVQALQNGELDLISVPATEDLVNAAKRLSGVEVRTGTQSSYTHIDLVVNNKGPFDPATYGGDADKAKLVRQAFLHSFPRQEIVDKLVKPVLPNASVRNSFLFPPDVPAYADAVRVNGSSAYANADPKASRALLQKAGVSTPIDVRVMYAKDSPRAEAAYLIYEQTLADAGFHLINARSADWSEKLGDGTYDVVLFSWQSSSTALAEAAATYSSQGGNNFQGYSNPEVDRLFSEMGRTTDGNGQVALGKKIDTLLFEDATSLTIYQYPAVTIRKKDRVENVDPAVLAPTIFYGFWNWTIP